MVENQECHHSVNRDALKFRPYDIEETIDDLTG